MVRLARILHDHREAGSVNGLLALWGFVDDTTFLTKAGHVGVVYRVRGVDCEGLSHAQRQTLGPRGRRRFVHSDPRRESRPANVVTGWGRTAESGRALPMIDP